VKTFINKKKFPWNIIFKADARKANSLVIICDREIPIRAMSLDAEVVIATFGKKGYKTRTFRRNIVSIKIIPTEGHGGDNKEKMTFS